MQIQRLKSKQGNLREQNKNMSTHGQTRPHAHERGAFDIQWHCFCCLWGSNPGRSESYAISSCEPIPGPWQPCSSWPPEFRWQQVGDRYSRGFWTYVPLRSYRLCCHDSFVAPCGKTKAPRANQDKLVDVCSSTSVMVTPNVVLMLHRRQCGNSLKAREFWRKKVTFLMNPRHDWSMRLRTMVSRAQIPTPLVFAWCRHSRESGIRR